MRAAGCPCAHGAHHRRRTTPVRDEALGAALTITALAALVWWRTPASFQDAGARAARATYLVATENDTRRAVVGTAFAVSADGLLATNAHVVHELRRRVALDERALVIRTEPTPDLRPIVALWPHPRSTPGSIRDDVAVIRRAIPAASASRNLQPGGRRSRCSDLRRPLRTRVGRGGV